MVVNRQFYLPPSVSRYWQAYRIWDRWEIEDIQLPATIEHVRQRELTIAEVRAIDRESLRVLDLCCGTGKVTSGLLELSNVREVVAVDISDRTLEILERRLADHPHRNKLEILQADLMEDDGIASIAGMFDVVVCLDALHHLWSLPDALSRVSRLIGKDGVLIANFLAVEHLFAHVSTIKKSWRFRLDKLLADLVRTLGFVGLIWKHAGRHGIVRHARISCFEVLECVRSEFMLSRVEQAGYTWFVASERGRRTDGLSGRDSRASES